jgi:hypothetical protein
MSPKQKRDYKAANQRRKRKILHLAKHGLKEDRNYWANMGHIQDGTYTK